MEFNLSLNGKAPLVVALDIGSHSIKVCELNRSGKGFKLSKLGSAILPEGLIEDGEVQDAEAVTELIRNLFKNLKIKNKKVGFSMSGYSVILKRINLSLSNDQDLEEQVRSEAEQYIPFDIDEVYLDYRDVSNTSTRRNQTDVMLVAAKKEAVDSYLDILKSAGLQPVLVDVDAFALENSFEINYSAEDNVLLVDIGAATTNINIVAEGTSLYARDASIGSDRITERIRQKCGVSREQAESLKIGGEVPPEEYEEDLEEIFADIANEWLREVKKAIDFHQANNPDVELEKIVLSGGGSKIEGLGAFFSQETGLAVERFDPFETVKIDAKKINPEYIKVIGPEMAIAMGMASRPSPL